MLTNQELEKDLERILYFIASYVKNDEKVVIAVSGGLDSDVVARLCAMALGRERLRLFTVLQEGLERKYTDNAYILAEDLGVPLAVISLGTMNRQLIELLHAAAPEEAFHPDGLLDVARANCSLRTAILSTYQEKGYLITGNSNRTEIELGFFLPFGDNLGHFKPLAHLYKSEVKRLAELVCSRAEVIAQSPSAGFWEGETDLEDMAYWLYNEGPVISGREFTDEESSEVARIQAHLSQEKIDSCLLAFHGDGTNAEIGAKVGLPEHIVRLIRRVKDTAASTKNRPLLAQLERI